MAERYDYRDAVREDIRQYIHERYSNEEICENLTDNRDGFEQELYDEMFVSDQVTGNASGSYTFGTWKAEENICHNLDLLGEAVDEFGGGTDVLKDGAEACDVTIRCYLLGQELWNVLDEMEEELC